MAYQDMLDSLDTSALHAKSNVGLASQNIYIKKNTEYLVNKFKTKIPSNAISVQVILRRAATREKLMEITATKKHTDALPMQVRYFIYMYICIPIYEIPYRLLH